MCSLIEVAANNEATEPRVLGDKNEVFTLKVLLSLSLLG